MNKDVFRTSCVTPIRGRAPGFATPIFTRTDSNQSWMQSFDGREVIRDFVPIEFSSNIAVISKVPLLSRQKGQNMYYAFCPVDGPVILGERIGIAGELHQQFSSLASYPFIKYQLAKFLGEDEVAARAKQDAEALLKPGVTSATVGPGVSASLTVKRRTLATDVPCEFECKISNSRATELEQVEVVVEASGGKVIFEGKRSFLHRFHRLQSGHTVAYAASVSPAVKNAKPGQEEIKAVFSFYDRTQRQGGGMYPGAAYVGATYPGTTYSGQKEELVVKVKINLGAAL